MLGRAVEDPHGIEGPAGSTPGLGLLEVETTLDPHKTLANVKAVHVASGTPLAGYEIHLGRTRGPDCARPFALIDGRPDGATSRDGRVVGTYLHGCFANDAFRRAFLSSIGAQTSCFAYEETVETALDDLADHLERHLDLDRLLAIAAPVG